jgi:hypothetical protein
MLSGWDLFTWFNCVVLTVAAITVFGFFLKDAKGILTGERTDAESGQAKAQPDADPEPLIEASELTLEGRDQP